MSLRSQVCEIIHARSGVTHSEIAKLIYGSGFDHGQVNRICRDLLREGHVHRGGTGATRDPYTYTWIRNRLRHGPDGSSERQQLSM